MPQRVARTAPLAFVRRAFAALTVAVVVLTGGSVFSAEPAHASTPSAAQSAAQLASASGFRTGIAVLDLQTGEYTGAGDDTGSFASESVVKVLIAAQLLLAGQMAGSTETTAYQMITQSDDDAADALYGLAGGDDVIDLVADHYHLTDLGSPPTQSGWWGDTEITAKGVVQLYAAIARDPVVGPWLTDAMAHTTEYAADGTDQFFGIPAATTGAEIKQGWGDDGLDTPDAVFNSTGYVDDGKFAVAILVDGAPDTYGAAISQMVTAEAQALMPGGRVDDPADHNPVLSAVQATSDGSMVHLRGTASDPDSSGSITIVAAEASTPIESAPTDDQHHFDLAFSATDGTHTYVVAAANVGEGSGDTSTTATVTVTGRPQGGVQTVTGGVGEITVTGWDVDSNRTESHDAVVALSVDGAPPRDTTVTWSAPTPAGPDGGPYVVSVPAPPGVDRLTIIYRGTSPAPNLDEGTWTVLVSAPEHRESTARRVTRISVAGLVALALA